MKVLVTGGGGFLGGEVARQLIARGDSIRILGRSERPDMLQAGAEVFRGDIADPKAVSEACRGMDAVVHCAAKAGVWGTREAYFSVNVTGTRNVIAACRECGIGILVHTSTPSVVWTGESFRGADESLPYGHGFICHYAETKALAEKEALAAHDPERLRVCALRPHLIWGTGDPHLLPRVIEAASKGKLAVIGGGKNRVDLTHVRNAAQAHILALDALSAGHAGGKAFFLSDGKPVDLWPWINGVLERLGVPKITKRVPYGVAAALAGGVEGFWKLFHLNGEPPLTRFSVFELAHDHWFDISAARRDLGYVPIIGSTEGVEDYVAHERRCAQNNR